MSAEGTEYNPVEILRAAGHVEAADLLGKLPAAQSAPTAAEPVEETPKQMTAQEAYEAAGQELLDTLNASRSKNTVTFDVHGWL